MVKKRRHHTAEMEDNSAVAEGDNSAVADGSTQSNKRPRNHSAWMEQKKQEVLKTLDEGDAVEARMREMYERLLSRSALFMRTPCGVRRRQWHDGV